MNLQNDLSCPLCDEQYQSDNLPRLLTSCGHTFCEQCLKKIMTEKKGSYKIVCPEDGEMISLQDSSMNNFPKNLALMKIMETKKNNSSFKDSSFDMSKIAKNDSLQDDEDARDLMDAIGSTTQTHQKDMEQKAEIEMCLLHQKPLEVVCILDLTRICANCAIFGEHKGHEFKSLDEIQKQRMDYYTSILNIMDKKQKISERISNEETCSEIMGILGNKKEKMKKSITNQYKKLIETIQLKQKQSLKHLDLVLEKTEGKVKNLMKIEPTIMQKYALWEDKSYEEIKILDGEDFQAKLQLLFVAETNYSMDVIEEGEKIIGQMNRQQQNLIQQVELALQNIGVDFNNEIFNHIEGSVEIYDEIKKKKQKSRATKNEPVNKSVPSRKEQILPKNINQPNKSVEIFEKQQKVQPSVQYAESIDDDQQDLLDEYVPVSKPNFVKQLETKTEPIIIEPPEKIEQIVEVKKQKSKEKPFVIQDIKIQKSPGSSKKDNSFVQQKIERPNKKKLSKIRLPQKYQKIVDGLANDHLELVDLTNAELGDNTILTISEFLYGSKVKTVKFIRNKISDQTVSKMLPYLGSIITLNLSQNYLTQHVLDILIDGRQYLSSMKNIILSQNKIVERKHKIKIEKLRSLDLIVSV